MSNQRAHGRVMVNHEFGSIDAFLTEYVSNISRGGVFIRSKSPLAVGTRVQLRFTVIVEDVETIEGEGEVVRLERGPNPGMGVAFTRLTERSQTLIDALLEHTPDGELVLVLPESDRKSDDEE